MKRSEIGFLLSVAIVLVAVGIGIDRIPRADEQDQVSRAGAFASAGWYCLTPPGEAAGATVMAASVGDDPVRLRASVVGEGKRSALVESDLPARRQHALPLAGFGVASASGLVEAFGEATSVNVFSPSGASGIAASRCTVQPASGWIIPALSTARGQDHILLIANPFEEEAVVRIRMISADRDIVPARLKDLVVPPLTQLAVPLVDYIPETPNFGVEITATQGRIVAGAFSRYSSKDGQKGTAIVLASRSTSQTWYFAAGGVPAEGEEFVAIINPTEKEALIQIIFHEEAAQAAPESLQEIPVPSGRQVMVKVSDHVSRGTAHGLTIASINEVPVVAQRLTFGGKAFDATIGSSSSARRWALGVGAPIAGTESIALINPGRVRATLDVVLLTDKGEAKPIELSGITVEAGRRLSIDLTPFLAGGSATAVIEAVSGEVVVERRFSAGAPWWDFADTMGQPLDD